MGNFWSHAPKYVFMEAVTLAGTDGEYGESSVCDTFTALDFDGYKKDWLEGNLISRSLIVFDLECSSDCEVASGQCTELSLVANHSSNFRRRISSLYLEICRE